MQVPETRPTRSGMSASPCQGVGDDRSTFYGSPASRSTSSSHGKRPIAVPGSRRQLTNTCRGRRLLPGRKRAQVAVRACERRSDRASARLTLQVRTRP